MNALDHSLGLQFGQSLAGSATVDLKTVHKNGDGDELVSGDFLHHLVHGGLVDGDGVVGLLLNLSLRPLLHEVLAQPQGVN